METRLIKNIVTIAKFKSISKAADELYLTQSALNQQLLKLEDELGAPIFNRVRNHWELTDVGALYVNDCMKILDIKNDTYKKIQDMIQKWNGTLTIGLTPERGISMFTSIYPKIHSLYPNVIFQPIEADVEHQNKLLEENKLDICFQTLRNKKRKTFVYYDILEEPFYLCVPKSHPLFYEDTRTPDDYPLASLCDFNDYNFTLVKRSSTMRSIIDEIFLKENFNPSLLFESISMRSMHELTRNGQCCSILPRCYAIPDSQLSYFKLDPSASWNLCAVYAKNRYISKAAKDFIKLATEYWTHNIYVNF